MNCKKTFLPVYKRQIICEFKKKIEIEKSILYQSMPDYMYESIMIVIVLPMNAPNVDSALFL